MIMIYIIVTFYPNGLMLYNSFHLPCGEVINVHMLARSRPASEQSFVDAGKDDFTHGVEGWFGVRDVTRAAPVGLDICGMRINVEVGRQGVVSIDGGIAYQAKFYPDGTSIIDVHSQSCFDCGRHFFSRTIIGSSVMSIFYPQRRELWVNVFTTSQERNPQSGKK